MLASSISWIHSYTSLLVNSPYSKETLLFSISNWKLRFCLWSVLEFEKVRILQLLFQNQIMEGMKKKKKKPFKLRCERGSSYTEYKKLSKRKFLAFAKCDCPFQLRSNLLSGGVWSLRVGDEEHNHEMTQFFQGHRYASKIGRKEACLWDDKLNGPSEKYSDDLEEYKWSKCNYHKTFI